MACTWIIVPLRNGVCEVKNNVGIPIATTKISQAFPVHRNTQLLNFTTKAASALQGESQDGNL